MKYGDRSSHFSLHYPNRYPLQKLLCFPSLRVTLLISHGMLVHMRSVCGWYRRGERVLLGWLGSGFHGQHNEQQAAQTAACRLIGSTQWVFVWLIAVWFVLQQYIQFPDITWEPERPKKEWLFLEICGTPAACSTAMCGIVERDGILQTVRMFTWKVWKNIEVV